MKGDRRFFSAQHDEIKKGKITDIYFLKTMKILENLKLKDTPVKAEIFAGEKGIFCGLTEVLNLLEDSECKIYSLKEGEKFSKKEVVMRIEGKYSEFGLHETAILGILASSSGWATARRPRDKRPRKASQISEQRPQKTRRYKPDDSRVEGIREETQAKPTALTR